MIVVTGGAGFIGSNLLSGLNARGRDDIMLVDDLSDDRKFKNIVDGTIQDYVDKDEFREMIEADAKNLPDIDIVFHQGACSDTTLRDGCFMMENNYHYSKILFEFCLRKQIPFIYASSAAVYGTGNTFIEKRESEAPLNIYGYSKFLFDEYVRRKRDPARSQIAGLRYFNVYGPREQHKGTMASMIFQINRQLLQGDKVSLFEGSGGYEAGEQRRDFIHVDDVVAVNLWFMQHPHVSGIFNVGTGRARSFNEVAGSVIARHGHGAIDYIPFPGSLKGRYQHFTEADLSALRRTGCEIEFMPLEQGVNRYLDWLNNRD
ncbi:MAG: ADP-glyceromanno-heptose 6-epimerase [Gammaproteobacteria bacterium]